MKLPSKLHISDVENLVKDLGTLLSDSSEVILDGSEVESVDTASLQAICALQRSLALTDNFIHWQGVSESLKTAATRLGVEEYLKLSV